MTCSWSRTLGPLSACGCRVVGFPVEAGMAGIAGCCWFAIAAVSGAGNPEPMASFIFLCVRGEEAKVRQAPTMAILCVRALSETKVLA